MAAGGLCALCLATSLVLVHEMSRHDNEQRETQINELTNKNINKIRWYVQLDELMKSKELSVCIL